MPRGTTCEEVERILRMRHQTVSARRTDLRAAGYTDYLCNADGERIKRPTSTGNGAYVEVATQLGRDVIDFNLPIQLNGNDPTRARHGDNPASGAAFKATSRSQDARRILECMRRFS